MIKAKQDVFLNAAGEACVAGPDARVVLVRAGQEIDEKRVAEIEGAEALINSESTKSARKRDGGKDLEERDEHSKGRKGK